MKQKELSILLRAVVVLCGLVWLVFANWFGRMLGIAIRDGAYVLAYPLLLCLMLLPPLVVLWDAWHIFTQIGRNNSFCVENARRLRRISLCALVDTVLDVVMLVYGLIYKFHISAASAPSDSFFSRLDGDVFGAVVRCLFVAFIGVAVTVAAAALSHLTLKAADLQDENDLTI